MGHFHRGPRRRGPASQGGRKAALGAFHDLNNHVHGIAMAVELALDEEAALSERHRDTLRQIESKCRELARLSQHLQNLGVLGTEGDAYAVVCIHCGEAILVVPHVGEAEARRMAEHLLTSHPDKV